MTPHAAERFEERVRPGLGFREASVELARLCREFGERVERPEWAPLADRPDAFWLGICDGVVVVCVPGVPGEWVRAVTVMTRAGMAPRARAVRNHRRHVERARVAQKRTGLGPRPQAARHFDSFDLGD